MLYQHVLSVVGRLPHATFNALLAELTLDAHAGGTPIVRVSRSFQTLSYSDGMQVCEVTFRRLRNVLSECRRENKKLSRHRKP